MSTRDQWFNGWRDACDHSPECQTESDCKARDAEQSSTQVATESTMPKKTKPPEEPQRDDNFAAQLAADEEKYRAEQLARDEQRKVERALMLDGARALLVLAAEQTATLRAQRFLAFAQAVAALKTLGGFPAIELIYNAGLNELTVLSRELHNARVAGAQS